MDSNIFLIVLLIIACIADVITRILTTVKKGNGTNTNPVLENALSVSDLINDTIKSLFLFAQKQNWTNSERMDYVLQKALSLFPDSVSDILKMPLTAYVQQLYNQFTSSYKALDKELEESKASSETSDKQ